jgi:hypothetical protein
MANNDNTINRNSGNPAFSQRDPSLPCNQTTPRSMRDSGVNLDEFCPEIEQASAGQAFDVLKERS